MQTIETKKRRAKLYRAFKSHAWCYILASDATKASEGLSVNDVELVTYASIIAGRAVFQDGKSYNDFIVAI